MINLNPLEAFFTKVKDAVVAEIKKDYKMALALGPIVAALEPKVAPLLSKVNWPETLKATGLSDIEIEVLTVAFQDAYGLYKIVKP